MSTTTNPLNGTTSSCTRIKGGKDIPMRLLIDEGNFFRKVLKSKGMSQEQFESTSLNIL